MFQVNPYHLWEYEQRQGDLIKMVRQARLAKEIQSAQKPPRRRTALLRIVSLFL